MGGKKEIQNWHWKDDFFSLDDRVVRQVVKALAPEERRLIRSYFYGIGKLEPEKEGELKHLLIRMRSEGNDMQTRASYRLADRGCREVLRVESQKTETACLQDADKTESDRVRVELPSTRPVEQSTYPDTTEARRFWKENIIRTKDDYVGKTVWDQGVFNRYLVDTSGGMERLAFGEFPDELNLSGGFVADGIRIVRAASMFSEGKFEIKVRGGDDKDRRVGELEVKRGLFSERVHRYVRIAEAIVPNDVNNDGLDLNPLLIVGGDDMVKIFVNQSEINVVLRSKESVRIGSGTEIFLRRIWNSIVRVFGEHDAFLDSCQLIRYHGNIGDGKLKRVRFSRRSVFFNMFKPEI